MTGADTHHAGANVRIFGTVISAHTRIIQIICEEAGLSHETIATPAGSSQNRHPFGKLPVVEADGLVLIESVAIAQYLDNRHNASALQSADPATRVVIDKWMALANNHLFALFERGLISPWVKHRSAGHPLDADRINAALPDISRALGFLEAQLQRDGAWVSSENALSFTLADVFIYPIIRALELTPQGEAGIGQCGALAAWMRTTEKRPSIAATRWETEP